MKPHQREGAAEPARSPDTRSDPDLAYPRGSHSAEASELPGGRGGKVRASPALRAGTRVQVTCKPFGGRRNTWSRYVIDLRLGGRRPG